MINRRTSEIRGRDIKVSGQEILGELAMKLRGNDKHRS